MMSDATFYWCMLVVLLAALVGIIWYAYFYEPKLCHHCGSRLRHANRGHYNRAWNSFCSQAAGAHGYFCKACMKVSWDEPDFNKWIERQPEWIVPYLPGITKKGYVVRKNAKSKTG